MIEAMRYILGRILQRVNINKDVQLDKKPGKKVMCLQIQRIKAAKDKTNKAVLIRKITNWCQ